MGIWFDGVGWIPSNRHLSARVILLSGGPTE
jgi:hypothetical protein